MNIITQKMKFRQSLMKYAAKYGVSKASRKYNKARSYIYFWKARWDGSVESLAEQSKRPHHHPNEHTEEEIAMIKRYRKWTFNGCRSLTSVKIPEGVTSIGEMAFQFCNSLTEIEIPENVVSIGAGAFDMCGSLEQIIYPNGAVIEEFSDPFDPMMSGPAIPEGSTQIKYEINADGSVKITDIILGTGKYEAEIPRNIGGRSVTSVAESVRGIVSQSGHTHNYENGKCLICGEDDPDYTPGETTAAATTTEPTTSETAAPDVTSEEETSVTTESGSESESVTTVTTESETTVTTAATAETATSCRPSIPAPAVTAVTTVTTVTTTTAETEIIEDDYTGDDVSVNAAVYEYGGGNFFQKISLKKIEK